MGNEPKFKRVCRTCEFSMNNLWFRQELAECRRHAPIREPNGNYQNHAWPCTASNDFCGDWKLRKGISKDIADIEEVTEEVGAA